MSVPRSGTSQLDFEAPLWGVPKNRIAKVEMNIECRWTTFFEVCVDE